VAAAEVEAVATAGAGAACMIAFTSGRDVIASGLLVKRPTLVRLRGCPGDSGSHTIATRCTFTPLTSALTVEVLPSRVNSVTTRPDFRSGVPSSLRATTFSLPFWLPTSNDTLLISISPARLMTVNAGWAAPVEASLPSSPCTRFWPAPKPFAPKAEVATFTSWLAPVAVGCWACAAALIRRAVARR